MVSLMGLNFHSTFSNSRCKKAPTRPAAACWIMTTGTICLGSNPSTSKRGVRAVPKPMPAEASMNSKKAASKTTDQTMVQSFPCRPWDTTYAEGIRIVASKGLPASQMPIQKSMKKTTTPPKAALICFHSGIILSIMDFFRVSTSRATSHPICLLLSDCSIHQLLCGIFIFNLCTGGLIQAPICCAETL